MLKMDIRTFWYYRVATLYKLNILILNSIGDKINLIRRSLKAQK